MEYSPVIIRGSGLYSRFGLKRSNTIFLRKAACYSGEASENIGTQTLRPYIRCFLVPPPPLTLFNFVEKPMRLGDIRFHISQNLKSPLSHIYIHIPLFRYRLQAWDHSSSHDLRRRPLERENLMEPGKGTGRDNSVGRQRTVGSSRVPR